MPTAWVCYMIVFQLCKIGKRFENIWFPLKKYIFLWFKFFSDRKHTNLVINSMIKGIHSKVILKHKYTNCEMHLISQPTECQMWINYDNDRFSEMMSFNLTENSEHLKLSEFFEHWYSSLVVHVHVWPNGFE